jgi:hypothetical protein
MLLNNNSWDQLHTLSPESMEVGNVDGSGSDEVIIDFGYQYGIWMRKNDNSWVKLHCSISPESMVTGNLDGLSMGDTAASIQGPVSQNNTMPLPETDAVLLPEAEQTELQPLTSHLPLH